MASLQHDICAICLEPPQTPKSLPTCTHLFCEACLKSYIRRHETEESVSCPTCTMACPTQDINIEAAVVAEPISRSTTKKLCTFCSYKGRDAKAEFFCDRCENTLLCRDCAASHGKKQRFRGHGTKLLSDFIRLELERCTRHAGRAMKFLCMGCDGPACEICAEVEHDDHELVDIGDVLGKLKDNLEPLNNAYVCATTLQRELQDVKRKEGAVIAQIINNVEQMKKELDKRGEVLVSAVKASTGGKQLEMEVCRLEENLKESLERARDISAVGVTNAEQFRNALSTEATLNKTQLDASKTIGAIRSRVLDISVPRFVQRKEVIIVGELEYQKTKTEPVRLELGGKYVRKSCYKIGKAVPFIREHKFNQGAAPNKTVAFLVKAGSQFWSWSLNIIFGLGKQIHVAEVKGLLNEASDMTVNNSGELIMLFLNEIYQYIPPVKQADKDGPLFCLGEVECAVSVAFTHSGQYVILHKKHEREATVSLRSADLKVIWGPITVDSYTLHPGQEKGLKILCPESTDLLLICDGKGEKVSAISLAVKQDSMVDGEVKRLERYFEGRTPILPPERGFYILDICTDEGKIYMCIKKGKGEERSPEAGPIQFCQASFANDKWHYTAIPLEDPTGKPFSELRKDEMLQLGAHKGTLMCLVYSPIPLTELRESKEPGMNITWYHGKLP